MTVLMIISDSMRQCNEVEVDDRMHMDVVGTLLIARTERLVPPAHPNVSWEVDIGR